MPGKSGSCLRLQQSAWQPRSWLAGHPYRRRQSSGCPLGHQPQLRQVSMNMFWISASGLMLLLGYFFGFVMSLLMLDDLLPRTSFPDFDPKFFHVVIDVLPHMASLLIEPNPIMTGSFETRNRLTHPGVARQCLIAPVILALSN